MSTQAPPTEAILRARLRERDTFGPLPDIRVGDLVADLFANIYLVVELFEVFGQPRLYAGLVGQEDAPLATFRMDDFTHQASLDGGPWRPVLQPLNRRHRA